MITLLEYIFYKYYKLAKIVVLDKTRPEINASIVLAFNITIDLLFVLGVASKLMKFYLPDLSPIIIIGSQLMLQGIVYFTFVSNSKYSKIVIKFQNESKRKRIVGNWLVMLYTFLTYATIEIYYQLFLR